MEKRWLKTLSQYWFHQIVNALPLCRNIKHISCRLLFRIWRSPQWYLKKTWHSSRKPHHRRAPDTTTQCMSTSPPQTHSGDCKKIRSLTMQLRTGWTKVTSNCTRMWSTLPLTLKCTAISKSQWRACRICRNNSRIIIKATWLQSSKPKYMNNSICNTKI